ncbi:MAG TPA: type II secretion system protein, partial [Candidatus Pacearchaeota archaeon]|nr:type II secretion system protein [Candidatus Pacearchaeota archaeon]
MLVKLKNKKNSYSFTLIELLVVISIIVILSSVIMVASGSFQEQARDNKRKEDLAAYQNALQIYYSEHKTYPSLTSCCAPQCLQSYLQNELSPLPQDPLDPNCSGGNYGYYYTSEDGKNYKLYAKLEKDFEAMKNDGGVDEATYEVYSTFGNQLAVTSYFGGLTSTALECSVISSETCDSEGGVNVLGLSAATNAHANISPLNQKNWLTNWSSRKAIIVDNTQNSSTLTDYQVSVDTTNAIYNETGLVGSWHMNENSGNNVSDMSGNSNNGTLDFGKTIIENCENTSNWSGSEYSIVQDSTFVKEGSYNIKLITTTNSDYEDFFLTFPNSIDMTNKYLNFWIVSNVNVPYLCIDPRNSSGSRMNCWKSINLTANVPYFFSGDMNTNTYKNDIKSIQFFTNPSDPYPIEFKIDAISNSNTNSGPTWTTGKFGSALNFDGAD